MKTNSLAGEGVKILTKGPQSPAAFFLIYKPLLFFKQTVLDKQQPCPIDPGSGEEHLLQLWVQVQQHL